MQVIRFLLCLLLASAASAADYTNLATGTVLANGDTLHYPSAIAEDPWAGYPTNIVGYSVYTWWPVDGNYNTSSYILTNLASSGAALNLTNTVGSASPTYVANAVNGKAVLHFDGSDDYLRNVSFTNLWMVGSLAYAPMEVWFVIEKTNYSSTAEFLMDSTSTAGRASLSFDNNSSPANVNFFGSSTLSGKGGVTNKWFIVSVAYGLNNANNTLIMTNNSQAALGAAKQNDQVVPGITVCGRYALNVFGNYFIAEIITWQTNLSTAVRSNVFGYLTNKYQITP